MNRETRLCVFAILGLLGLTLFLSPTVGIQPLAQDVQPGAGALSDPILLTKPSAVHPEENPDAASAYLQIAGQALKPELSDVVWNTPSGFPGCIYANGAGLYDLVWWNAPITPPAGATLTNLRVFVRDNHLANSHAALGVVDQYGVIVTSWEGYSEGMGGTEYFDIPIPDHVVNYATYSYLLRWQPVHANFNEMICGFRLSYIPVVGSLYLPSVFR